MDQAKGKDEKFPSETLGHTFRWIFERSVGRSPVVASVKLANVTKPRWWFQTTGYFLWSLATAMSY